MQHEHGRIASWGRIISIALMLATSFALAQGGEVRKIGEPSSTSPHLVLTEVLRLGSADDASDAFGRAMDVAFGASGRIFVADDLNHRIAVFEADGRFRQFLGRKGRGPGEFESPWRVTTDIADSVFVWDIAQARILVFGPDLIFRRDFRVPPHWLVNAITFLPDGRLVLAAYGRGDTGTLHILARDGTLQRTFGSSTGKKQDFAGFESSVLGGTVDRDGKTLVYSNKSPYEVTFYDLNGRIKRICAGRSGLDDTTGSGRDKKGRLSDIVLE